MVDEQDLRDLADELRGLYRELDELKYQPPAPRETRVMKPRPGPSAPGNWFAMALDRDMTADLFEMVRDAANHVDPTAVIHHQGQWLCEWIKLKSFYIASDFPAALELHELMSDQARRLNRRLHPPEASAAVRAAVKTMERKVSAAEAASLASAATGITIDRKQVTYWGRSGRISVHLKLDGTATYYLDDVIEAAKAYKDGRFKSG